jgi:hypothetical protein
MLSTKVNGSNRKLVVMIVEGRRNLGAYTYATRSPGNYNYRIYAAGVLASAL